MHALALLAWLSAGLAFWPALGGAEPTIRLGLTLALTGQYAPEAGYVREAYVLWAEDVNRRGGLLGRPVALVVRDDQSDPARSARLYEQLIDDDRVDLILGPYSSPIALAASAVADRLRYPFLVAAAATEIWEQGFRYVFGVYPSAQTYFEGMIELAAEHGTKTLAVINEESVFPRSAVLGAIRMAQDYGMRVVGREVYASPLTDARSLLLALRPLTPDLLIVAGYLRETLLIARQAREVDLRAKAMAFSVGAAMPDFAGQLARDAEYVFGPSLWEPSLRTPGNREFVERYRARWGRDPSYHAAAAWATATVFEAAVRRAGSIDRERLRRILTDLEVETVLPGAFEVDRNGLQVGHKVLIVQWQKGRKEIVWPRRYATARPVLPAPPWKRR